MPDQGDEQAPFAFTRGQLAESHKKASDYFGKTAADKSSDAMLLHIGAPAAAFEWQPIVVECEEYAIGAEAEAEVDAAVSQREKRQIYVARARKYRYARFDPLRAQMESQRCRVECCWLTSAMRSTGNVRACGEVGDDASVRLLDLPRQIVPEMTVAGPTLGAEGFRGQFSVTGKGVRVALIEREPLLDHPALAGRISLRGNLTNEPAGHPTLHGTAVAGIIASSAAESPGIAPEAVVFNYKVLPAGDDFDAARALEQALADDAHVVNCSWGTGGPVDGSSRETRAVNAAWKLGMVVVKSAGNGGPRSNTMTAPADADGVIVVAATDRSGKAVPQYSSRGPTDNRKHPTVCAPGGTNEERIVCCLADPSAGPFGGVPPGTSLATAFVTGAVALLLELAPQATPDRIRELLMNACRPFPNNDPNIHGAGMLDLRMIASLPAVR